MAEIKKVREAADGSYIAEGGEDDLRITSSKIHASIVPTTIFKTKMSQKIAATVKRTAQNIVH